MNPSNQPHLVLILLFLSNESLPLEVGYDFTPIVDDDRPAVCQGEVSLLDCQGVPVQPDVDVYSCSIKACVNIFTCNKAKQSPGSAQLVCWKKHKERSRTQLTEISQLQILAGLLVPRISTS